jgi:hypothetical protein
MMTPQDIREYVVLATVCVITLWMVLCEKYCN